jgi:Protein of unknown function (DUF4242)
VPSFILETYVARLSADGLNYLVARAKLATTGTPVSHIRSYFVPEDDMCMHVFEGPSVAAVQKIADSAGLETERIVQSVGELADSTSGRNT